MTMNTDDDQTTQAIANNTSPFHFNEVDTIAKPEIGFTTPTFIALTKDQTSIKRYFSADEAETDFGFDSKIYKQIANYFDNEGNVSQLVLILFNPDKATPAIPVTAVTLDKTTVAGKVGDKGTLTPSVVPASATDKSGTFTSSDDSIVTVDDKGAYELVKAGTATITFETTDGGFKATCDFTVSASN